MTRGFLIFAFNNEVLDYLGHALWIADRIERILGLPTSIVTDEASARTKQNVQHNLIMTEALAGHQRNFNIHEDGKSFRHYDYLPKYKFPHYWATVIFFRKSKFSKIVFETIQMIRENYAHYSRIYKFRSNPFRNDYVVSIALSIVYGHRINNIPEIPWNMPMIATNAKIMQLDDCKFEIQYQKTINKSDKLMRVTVQDHDIHFLNKFSLEKMING
jgi:hypothetical protein